MITPSTAQQATFVLDGATGDLQVMTPGGILIASFGFLQQLELLHLVTGAHLQLIQRLNEGVRTMSPMHVADAQPVVAPILSPVG